MYAIIRAGGKQAKVQSGDVIEVERIKGSAEKLTFAPLLVVDDDGKAVSDKKVLDKAKVTAKVLGETKGPKIDIFKYKNKTGYRRRQGHRQTYTQIEITGITLPGAKAAAKATTTEKAEAEPKVAAKTAAEKPAAKTEAEPKTAAKKPAAKKPAAKTETSKTAKPAAKKPAAKKPAAKKPPAKPKAADADSSEET